MAVQELEATKLLEAGEQLAVELEAPEAAGSAGSGRGRKIPVRAVGLLVASALLACVLATALRRTARHELAKDGITALASVACATGRSNCKSSQCCAESGMQCYEQDESFAMCRPSCTPGPDPTFDNGKAWSCAELGTRSAGEYVCGKPGEDCSKSQCCADPGMQCYVKNASWATCKSECVPGGPDIYDVDGTPWSCSTLGEPAPSTAPWVTETCSSGWQDCTQTSCCKLAGEQCTLQSDYFGQCKAKGSCSTPGWSCKGLGSQTPPEPQKGGMLSPWAMANCNKEGEGCASSKCCLGMDLQCYEKGPGWAQCLPSCTPGPHADDNNETWWCKPMGMRSYGYTTKGSPSLFCFSVIRTSGYEVSLMASQQAKGVGIWGCDGHSLLTADGNTTVGGEETISFQGAPIVTSVDGTAGNTWLFVNAWNVLIARGEWKMHSFIAKVDPDAVFFADRLRWHMAPYLGQKMYVINCHVGDMIYGALEVFSFAAIQDWANRHTECNAPNNFGEDKYMTQCMDHLGAARVHDEAVLGDKLCGTFTSCSNGWNAAFHPFKDIGSWEACWNEATAHSQAA